MLAGWWRRRKISISICNPPPKKIRNGWILSSPFVVLVLHSLLYMCPQEQQKKKKNATDKEIIIVISTRIFVCHLHLHIKSCQLICLSPVAILLLFSPQKLIRIPQSPFIGRLNLCFACLSVCLSTCHWTHQPGYVALIHFGSSTTTIPPPQISTSSLLHIAMAIVLGQECLLCKHFYHP